MSYDIYNYGHRHGYLLMADTNETDNLGSTCHNAPKSPVGSSGNVSHGSGHGRRVGRDVVGRQLLELDDALGDLQHGLDEVVKGLKPWPESVVVL